MRKDIRALWITITIVVAFLLILYPAESNAAISNNNVLSNVLDKYQAAASTWAAIIVGHASWLFWVLATISLVFTFGFMALRQADLGEFAAELIRFVLFVGFFWWLLTNGPAFAKAIVDSLRQIGGQATGLGPSLGPSGIVDIGFNIFYRVLDQSSVTSPLDSLVGIGLSLAVLIILALVGVNMLVLLCAAWVLMYAGVFFLGFGGSRWTSDMAINYYKTVLGIAASLMTMVLLIGVGQSIIDQYYTQMSVGVSLKEMGVLLVVVVVLYSLINRVPGMVASIVTPAGGGMMAPIGGTAMLAGAGMAGAAAGVAGSVALQGARSMAGGASAVKAAYQAAQHHMSTGTGSFSGQGGTGTSGGLGGLAAAMGQPGRFMSDMGKNLAQGVASAAKDKGHQAMDRVRSSVGETFGGQVASAIKSTQATTQGGKGGEETATFSGNTVGASKSSPSGGTGTGKAQTSGHPEVDAFVNKMGIIKGDKP